MIFGMKSDCHLEGDSHFFFRGGSHYFCVTILYTDLMTSTNVPKTANPSANLIAV